MDFDNSINIEVFEIDWVKSEYLDELKRLSIAYLNESFIEEFIIFLSPDLPERLEEGCSYTVALIEIDINQLSIKYFGSSGATEIEEYLCKHNTFFEKIVRRLLQLIWIKYQYNIEFYPHLINPWANLAYDYLSEELKKYTNTVAIGRDNCVFCQQHLRLNR